MTLLLSPDAISEKLSSWKDGLLEMENPIPTDVLDLCDSLTFTHITSKFDRVHGSVGSLDSMSDRYFWRSMALWAEFGSSWYNAIDLSLLLGVHHVVLASWIERHGIDWIAIFRRKVGFRFRENPSNTVFLDTNGRMHTEVTFNHVHATSIQTIRARLKGGYAVLPSRSLEAADIAFTKELRSRNPTAKIDYKSYMFARCLRRVTLYKDTRYATGE